MGITCKIKMKLPITDFYEINYFVKDALTIYLLSYNYKFVY